MKNNTERLAKKPITLKVDKKKDSSKQCNDCKKKRWKEIEYT
jgi:hypothetical protein